MPVNNSDELYRRDKYVVIGPFKEGSKIFDKLKDDYDIDIIPKVGYKIVLIQGKIKSEWDGIQTEE